MHSLLPYFTMIGPKNKTRTKLIRENSAAEFSLCNE